MYFRALSILSVTLGSALILWQRHLNTVQLSRLASVGDAITLKDGRRLGYAEYGDPNGEPVFFFHGTAGSRLAGRVFHTAAVKLGGRLIAPERPGYGFSTPQPDRTLLGWVDDVIELADTLGIERFAVFGVSGGGPHAAACAYKLPERLTTVGLVASVAPPDDSELIAGIRPANYLMSRAGRISPWLAGMMGWITSLPLLMMPGQVKKQALKLYPEYDHLLEEIIDIFVDDTREAFRSSVLGFGTDFVSARPWGFDLSAITVKPVYLWHGEADINVPPAMGYYLAARVPNCQATFYPGEDHAITSLTHGEEVLSALLNPGE